MHVLNRRLWCAVVSIIALNCSVMPVEATERYWIAHEAQLIVVGVLHPGHGFWWLDGWHETGTITVNEVLYGRPPSGQIQFRLTIRCFSPWWNRWRPTHFMNRFSDTGIWFLRQLDDRIWEPANDCDSGYRLLTQRPDFEQYIRREKQ